MTIDQLAQRLRETRANAPTGEKEVRTHLFGIQFVAELDNSSLRDIVRQAGESDHIADEIRKGMKLAPYVELTCSL